MASKFDVIVHHNLDRITDVEVDNLKKRHIQISKEDLRDSQQSGDFPDDNPRYRVDNVWDRVLEKVRFLGKIEFYARSQNVKMVVLDIMNLLVERSIVGEEANRYGIKYNERHTILLNNKVINHPDELDYFEFGDEIRIVNLAPYARRLELLGYSKGRSGRVKRLKNTKNGKDSKNRPKVFSRPNGAYVLAHRVARSRHKQIGSIKFEFTPMNQGLSMVFKTGQKSGRGKAYLYPSIVIKPDAKGVVQ